MWKVSLDSFGCRTNFRVRILTERNAEYFQFKRKDNRTFTCFLFTNFLFHLPVTYVLCLWHKKKGGDGGTKERERERKKEKGKNSSRTSKGWADCFSCPWFIVMHTFTILKNPRDASSSTKHKITLLHPQKCFVWRTTCPTIHHRSRFYPLTLQRGCKFATGGASSSHCSTHP